MTTRKKAPIKVGDPVTCIAPVCAWYSGDGGDPACLLEPGDVGTVASIDLVRPMHFRVDFYKKDVARSGWPRTPWRTSLRSGNIRPVSSEAFEAYLRKSAPPWSVCIVELAEGYQQSFTFIGALSSSAHLPFLNQTAYEKLIPFLQTRPTQPSLQMFAETMQQEQAEFERFARGVYRDASTLVVANMHLDEIRIPWKYVVEDIYPQENGSLPSL